MRYNTIISQLTNENHIIKIKYNELYEKYKILEEKLENMPHEHPLCPCSRPPCPIIPPSNENAIIESLQNKILELNKQIILQNKLQY